MSIRNKILLSMLMIALLFIPVNILLLKRYLDIKEDFLTIVDKTVPRLNALLTMRNLTTHINLFINNFDFEFQQASTNSNTPTKLGAVKDEFLSLLEELGEQQKIYKRYQFNRDSENVKKLDKLRDKVILAALNVFTVKEQKIDAQDLGKKTNDLKSIELQLDGFI